MNYELKRSSFDVNNLSEPEIQKLTKLCDNQINLGDLERFMKNLKIFDVEKPAKQENTQDTEGMVKKLEIKNFLENKLEYRYIKPD